MTTNYWMFKPADDGSQRVDVLVENTDRDPQAALPDVIDVQFYGDPNNPVTSVRTDQLVPTTAPG